jgi:Cys-rich protein (TIGR01571 family)
LTVDACEAKCVPDAATDRKWLCANWTHILVITAIVAVSFQSFCCWCVTTRVAAKQPFETPIHGCLQDICKDNRSGKQSRKEACVGGICPCFQWGQIFEFVMRTPAPNSAADASNYPICGRLLDNFDCGGTPGQTPKGFYAVCGCLFIYIGCNMLLCRCMLTCCIAGCTRRGLRRRLNIKGNFAQDCLIHLCCHICALCQEARALRDADIQMPLAPVPRGDELRGRIGLNAADQPAPDPPRRLADAATAQRLLGSGDLMTVPLLSAAGDQDTVAQDEVLDQSLQPVGSDPAFPQLQ